MGASSRPAAIAVLALGLVACAGDPPPDVAPACDDVGARAEPASAPDRRIVGLASEYPADGMLASRMDELLASHRARRAAAWEVVARVIEPLPLAEATSVEGASLPRFRTWYDHDDFARLFGHAYAALTPEQRAARARIPESLIEDAFAWNLHVLDDMPAWTDQAWADYVAGIEDPLDVAGLPGLRRIAISPDAARHVARSYPEILRCLAEGAPPAIADGPAAPQQLAREPIALEACGARVLGPYYVAGGATIAARFESAHAAEVVLTLLEGETLPLAAERCSAPADVGCEANGPGAFFVRVEAASRANEGTLEVTYASPDVPLASCLDGAFPLASATVAMEWRRVELGPLPTYDTSAAGLAARLAPGADATWGEGDGTADPGPDEIYTLRVPAGGTFRLAGMHIRTRELDRWVNITLWWSDRPDDGFGADRPDAIRALGGPWSHYAMCVAIDDVERDPDPTGGLDGSLGEALAAVHDGVASWCSNPYIDAAPGLARSNCVGCHQHAMSGLRPGEIVMDASHFPAEGRLFVRNNFPADQFWGLDAGDDLATIVSDNVEYWSGAAP